MHVCRAGCRTRLHPPRRAPLESRRGQRRATHGLGRMFLMVLTACVRTSGRPRARGCAAQQSELEHGGARTNSERELRGCASMQAVSVRTPETQGPSTTSSESLALIRILAYPQTAYAHTLHFLCLLPILRPLTRSSWMRQHGGGACARTVLDRAYVAGAAAWAPCVSSRAASISLQPLRVGAWKLGRHSGVHGPVPAWQPQPPASSSQGARRPPGPHARTLGSSSSISM